MPMESAHCLTCSMGAATGCSPRAATAAMVGASPGGGRVTITPTRGAGDGEWLLLFNKNIGGTVGTQAAAKVTAQTRRIRRRAAYGTLEQERPVLPRDKAGQVQFRRATRDNRDQPGISPDRRAA